MVEVLWGTDVRFLKSFKQATKKEKMVCACVVDMQCMISLRAVMEIRGMGPPLLVVGGISLPVLPNHK